ncbi:MAG: hypothetical protein AAFS10_27275, partial [Myxococcota bacterium]
MDYTSQSGSGADCALLLNETIERFDVALGTWIVTPQNFNYPNGSTQVRIRVEDPNSGLSAEATSSVQVEDTQPPFVFAGTDVQVECTSPDMTPFTPEPPTVRDTCTSDVTVVTNLPDPPEFPYGVSEVVVTATDSRGQTASDSFNVRIIDTTPPEIDAGGAFSVPQRGDCDVMGSGDGTRVTLPLPSVTDTCSSADSIQLINNITNSNARTVCLPNGATTSVQWTAFDRNGQTATDTVDVTITTSTFTLQVDQAPTGWTNAPAPEVRAVALGAGAPVNWTLIGDLPPTTPPGTAVSVSALFANEATYCPLYISASSGGQVGLNDEVCFGVERTQPQGSFSFDQRWFDTSDPTIPVAVDPNNSQTWPLYFEGERLRAEVSANDRQGSVRSGLARVQLIIDPSTPDAQTVIDWTGTTSGTLATGPLAMDQLGCNTSAPICDDSNRLDLARLDTGEHTIVLVVTDVAGNSTQQQWFLRLK